MVYRFASCQFDPARRSLTRDACPVELTATELDLLQALLVAAVDGRRLSAAELSARFWPHDNWEHRNLRTHISNLRRKLGAQPDGRLYIPKGVYVVAAPVTTDDGAQDSDTAVATAAPEVGEAPWRARLRESAVSMCVALGIVVTATMTFVVPSRALLAHFHLTTSQLAERGFFEGIFHGVVGATIWSVCIGGALLVWWCVGEGGYPWNSRIRYWRSVAVATAGGFAGGVINSMAVILVYGPSSLRTMGWITADATDLPDVVAEPFVQTGIGYTMPVLGAAAGFGIASVTLRWLRERRDGDAAPSTRLVRSMAVEAARRTWLLAAILVVTAAAFDALIVAMPQPPLAHRWLIAGECVSVFAGGLGLTLGLGLARLVPQRLTLSSRIE